MQRGPSVGARFLLDAPRTVAGRSVDADIFLDDVTVSRKHAEFVRDGDDFVMRDIGSLNGTYVNRSGSTPRPCERATRSRSGSTV